MNSMNIEHPALPVTSTAAAAPAITVLMTCYNTERYVAETIESILNQTFTDFEFVIVNDGSTDRSPEIIERYATRDGRIRVLSGPNSGIVGAACKGMAVARGEFIARIDSDDVALPTRLEKQVEYLRENPDCVAVGSRTLITDPEGEVICEWGKLTTHQDIDNENMTTGGPGLIHCAAMFRRQVAVDVGGYRKAYEGIEDLDLFLRLAEKGRLANLTEPLSKWRQHPKSCCHTRTGELRSKFPLVIADAYRRRGIDAPVRPPEPTPRPLSEADHHLRWAWWALMDVRVPVARKHAFAALRRKPFSTDTWRAVACAVRGR
jgi:glycosyltransferase involved in cell wall biosynthesis